MTSYSWGVLGTGNIARSMAAALPHVAGARRAAVASRSEDTARAFANAWGFDQAYGSYDDLMQDQDIDIIYVATPNALHKENILAALNAGKHVLCEKPMTLSTADNAVCFDLAQTKGLVLMEALWTAFFPAMQKAIELVRTGAIGMPRHLTANFVSYRDPAKHPNLFDPALGGGARNDLGIYPIAAALLLAGPVALVKSHSLIGPTGVDEMTAWILEHENGTLSQLSCGFNADVPISVRLAGSKGSIEIPNEFHQANKVLLTTEQGAQSFELPYIGNGYAHEAIAFQNQILGDVPLWGRAETLNATELIQAT